MTNTETVLNDSAIQIADYAKQRVYQYVLSEIQAAYDLGFQDGYNSGYDDGRDDGWIDGFTEYPIHKSMYDEQ